MREEPTRNDTMKALKLLKSPTFEMLRLTIEAFPGFTLKTNNPHSALQQIEQDNASKGELVGTDGKKGKKQRKRTPSPEEQFQSHIHRTTDGRPGISIRAITAMIKTIARRIPDVNADIVVGALSVYQPGDEVIPFTHYDELTMKTSPALTRRKTMQTNYQPEYKSWRLELTLVYDETFTNAQQVTTLIELGGWSVGLGSSRAETGGQHGRFRIDRQVQTSTVPWKAFEEANEKKPEPAPAVEARGSKEGRRKKAA